MRHGCCQLDMAHAFAAHLRQGDFNAAFLAYNAAIFHPLVFAAQTFIVTDWTENTCTEQTILFRLERAVIDGFRLFNLTE